MFRVRSRSCVAVVICCLLAALAQGQVLKKQCAAFNEYCLYHWDCCSNSCMTYMYRCSRNYSIYPYAFLGTDVPASGTLNEILAVNFGNSVNKADEEQQRRQQPPQPPQPQQPGIDFSSRFDDVLVEDRIGLAGEELQKATTTTLPATIILEAQQLGEVTQSPTTIAPQGTADAVDKEVVAKGPFVEPCKAIGKKCYRHEECCTQRCHGFLHQCVT